MKHIFTTWAVLLPLSASLLVGCTEEKPEVLIGSAKTYLTNHDANAAAIQLKRALQQRPDFAEARFLLGQALLESAAAVEAEVEFRKALDLGYPQSKVLPLLARSLLLQGKEDRVIKEYAAVKLTDPRDSAALKIAVAAAYSQKGDKPKADGLIEEVLASAPEFSPALLIKARHKARERDFDGAFVELEKVLGKEPSNYEALQLKGDLLFYGKGDVQGALAAERQALAVRKNWLPAHSSALEILLAQNDIPGAKNQLAELRKVWPDHPQTNYFAARVAYLEKDFTTAKELTQRLLQVAPDDAGINLLAASLELQTGSILQAEGLAAKVLKEYPGHLGARRVLAEVYLTTGQTARAAEALAPVMQSGEVDAATLTLAARLALKNNDTATAEKYFARAAQRDPTDPRSRTALALSEFSKGNTEVAFSQLQQISSTDQGTVADMGAISARLRQKDYAGALKAIEALERKEPKKPLASHLRGQVYLASRNLPAARQSFKQALVVDPTFFPAAANLAALDLQERRPDEARKHFDKLLEADPKNLQALMALAELRAKSGASKAEVVDLLRNAARLNPTEVAPRLTLVEVHLRTKDTRAAIEAAQEGVATFPNSPEMLEALGRAQQVSGDVRQAITTYRKLATTQPRSSQALLRLGDAYAEVKDFDAARESLTKSLEVTPKFLPGQRGLVLLELATGRPEQAMAVARTVQKERPNESAGFLFAGDIESARKNWDAASVAYRNALSRGASSEIAIKLHNALQSGQKQKEADTLASLWVTEHPNDATFRVYLGDLALSRSYYAAAEGHFSAVVKLQPENPIALNNLAVATHALKKPNALSYAEKANSVQPGQPSFMDTLATILADSGDVRKAIDVEKQALSIAPEFHAARLNLAKFYLQAGEKAQAKAELDRLAKLGQRFAAQAQVVELQKQL